jgi:rRNA maturation endonuclease Nob1
MSEAIDMIYDTLSIMQGSVIKQSLITEKANCSVCDKWYDETLDNCPNCGSDHIFVTNE